jgi:hypothetical protein
VVSADFNARPRLVSRQVGEPYPVENAVETVKLPWTFFEGVWKPSAVFKSKYACKLKKNK